MKELSIEQKAKAYDEAFERAKSKIKNDKDHVLYEDDVIEIFPELKESEDERIRKSIIAIINNYVDNSNTFKPEMIAWLEKQGEPQVRTGIEWVNTIDDACDKRYSEEYAHGEYCHEQSFKWGFQEGVDWFEKQGEQKLPIEKLPFEMKTVSESLGLTSKKECDDYNKMVTDLIMSDDKGEQKPTDKVEPKFKVGDWVINTITKEVEQVIELTGCEYICSGHLIVSFNNQHLLKRWTIQDAKDGDVLVNWNNTIYLFKGIEEEVVKFYCYYNTNREEFNTPLDNNSHLGLTEPQFEHHPATKEQRNSLFQKIHEAGYTWDAEKKELKKEKVDNLHNYLYSEQSKTLQIDDVPNESSTTAPLRTGAIGFDGELMESKPCEQNPAWSKEDDYVIERLFCLLHNEQDKYPQQSSEFQELEEIGNKLISFKDRVQSKQEWSEEDEETLNDIITSMTNLKDSATSDALRYIYNSKIDWLKSLKYSVRPQTKWSEEDEKILNSLIISLVRIGATTRTDSTSINYTFSKEIDWLKSLKDRYTWKPSEEEMVALEHAINCYSSISPTNTNEVFILEIMKERLKNLTK